MTEPLFDLGRVVITPSCLAALTEAFGNEWQAQAAVAPLLAMHQGGQFGDLSPADHRVNAAAVKNGSRILSAYAPEGVKLWIITDGETDACPACTAAIGECEPDKGEWSAGLHFRTDLPPRRLSTTVLLPEDY